MLQQTFVFPLMAL